MPIPGSPSDPWFEAEQRSLARSPGQTMREPLAEDDPLRRAIETIAYPAGRDEVLAACAEDPAIRPTRREWLAARLPDATFARPGDVFDRLGRSGLGPPHGSLLWDGDTAPA